MALAKARNYLRRRPTVNIRVHSPSAAPPFARSPIGCSLPVPPTPTTVHAGVVCDGCEKAIVGTRHKCLDCSNFDLCSECLSNPQIRRGHNAKHGFFPIEVPGDHTLFEGVQSDRKGVEHFGITCDGCHTRVHGVRHKCMECEDFDLCETCISSVTTRAEHDYKHHFFPIPFPWDNEAFRLATTEVLQQHTIQTKPRHAATCDGCSKGIEGVRYRCLVCDDFDFCSDCHAEPEKRLTHDLAHAFFPLTTQRERSGFEAIRACMNAANDDGPVIHTNIVCNQCEDIIIGVRHKCLDCRNYDLCGDCVAQGAKRNHNSAHQFFEITKPGEVIVHHVRMPEPDVPAPVAAERTRNVEPIVHNAVCNLCDSTIRGDRYVSYLITV